MDRVHIERLGGFAGYGGPASRIKSKGSVSLGDLSTADRKRVDDLFKAKGKTPPPKPDAFHYRITRQTPAGEEVTLAPEELVPEALRNSVKDTLE